MAAFLYNFLLLLLMPAIAGLYIWRIFAGKSNESWPANLGALPRLADRPSGRKLVWFHAASVGEVIASLPVQQELKRLEPETMILLTTVTQAGNQVAQRKAAFADAISYLPLDYPFFVARALNRVRPDVFVMVEAEVWPNLLASARKRRIKTVLINGRVSDRTAARCGRFPWIMSRTISGIDRCFMQSAGDAQRIIRMGARPEVVQVLGNTKFDEEGERLSEDGISKLRADLGFSNSSRVFIAGSTNEGEEGPVLEAFREMKGDSDLRLIIAPRHIERAAEIQAMVEADGFTCRRYSSNGAGPEQCDVLVLDTFGELAHAYAVGQLAFVGGTLIRKGGHSLIQPIMQGKPVLFGPYTFKTKDIAQMAKSAGVGFEVRDAHELAERGRELLADERRLAEIDRSCRLLISENTGASGRCARAIADALAGLEGAGEG